MSIEVTPSRVGPPGPDPARAALFVLPIVAYYYAKDRWLGGDAVYAGGLAALVANLVLAGYIVAACLEDDGTRTQSPPKRDIKKTQ